MKNNKIFIMLLLSTTLFINTYACTMAVISGNVTSDGRPVLWKNRDTKAHNNEIKFFNDGIQNDGYVGIVDGDTADISVGYEYSNVRAGLNSHGFALCNTQVMNKKNLCRFQKQALRRCKTVDEFRDYITEWDSGDVSGIFGAIDTLGNASIFEIHGDSAEPLIFKEHNVNNIAKGFMAVSNQFSIYYDNLGNEIPNQAFYDCKRRQRADKLLTDALSNGTLDYKFAIQSLSKSGYNNNPGITETMINDEFETDTMVSKWVTRSAAIVHGVKPGEPASLSTFWSILGEPLFSVAIPVFVNSHSIPYELEAGINSRAPFLSLVWNNEMRCYDHNSTYFDRTIWTNTETGKSDTTYYNDTKIRPYPLYFSEDNKRPIMEYATEIEDELFNRAETFLFTYRNQKTSPNLKDLRLFSDNIAQLTYKWYLNEQVQ